jgi:Effector-associated domain 2
MIFADALVAWVVAVVGDWAFKGGAKALVLGRPERQALEAAMRIACTALLSDVPPSAQQPLAATLADCFSDPPQAALDGRASVKDSLIQGLTERICPLADRNITPSGRSYFDELGVDGHRLIEDLPVAVLRSIQQVGPRYPALQPLVAQLNADSILERIDRILDAFQERVLHPAAGTLPALNAGLASRPASTSSLIDPVIDAVLLVPSMADYGARMAIIGTLPPRIRDAIPRNAIARIDILNTIRTCENYTGGLRELIGAIRSIEGDSRAMAHLETVILALDDAEEFPIEKGKTA